MHNPCAMRVIEGMNYAGCDLQHCLEGHWASRDPLCQGFTFEILHDEVIRVVLATDVMECADVRMREGCNRFGFALEPTSAMSVGGQVCRQYLQCHDALKARVAGLVDLAHAAGTEKTVDLVRPKTCTDRKRGAPQGKG